MASRKGSQTNPLLGMRYTPMDYHPSAARSRAMPAATPSVSP
jgi:hypothetical protein